MGRGRLLLVMERRWLWWTVLHLRLLLSSVWMCLLVVEVCVYVCVCLVTPPPPPPCAGLTEGFHQSGVAEAMWAVEKDEAAANAFKLNYPSATVMTDDCNLILRLAMEVGIVKWHLALIRTLQNQDTSLIRTPHESGHLTNQDTPKSGHLLIRTPYQSGHSLIWTPH